MTYCYHALEVTKLVLYCLYHSQKETREKLKDVMDYSNLPIDDPFYDKSKAKVPGYWKTETPNSTIVKCIAPKSKCYVLRTKRNQRPGGEEIEKKCKGITKARVKRMNIDSYTQCINSISVIKMEMAHVQVKNHNIQTVIQNKVCLSSFDDKRFLLTCGKHSRPYQSEEQSSICDICQI